MLSKKTLPSTTSTVRRHPHLSRLLLALAFAVASPIANLFAAPPSYAVAGECNDVRFIFARGSGEALGGPSMSAWRDEIISALGETTGNFSYGFYELGSQAQNGHQYPAVAVSGSFDGYANLIGAYVSGGAAFDFGASVEEGIEELRAYISNVEAFCPQTRFVLGGYSQGAMVLSATLPSLDADKIIYVSTFGDPKLYLPEGKPNRAGRYLATPDACRGRNLSPYRIDVADCRAYEGVLGSYRPYQPEGYSGKLGTWCNAKDIMCSSGLSLSDHTSYVSSNLYRDAAKVIAQKLVRALPDVSNIIGVIKKAKHNVAFVIDTTSSMKSVIDSYKAEAKKLAAEVKADNGNIALFEYGDLAEMTPRSLCDLSCSLTDFSEKVDAIALHGGGDFPESVLSALLHALNGLDWQTGATKSIVLLTDATYHSPDRDGTTLAEVVQRSLSIDPVNVYIIAPQNVNQSYQELAEATSGQVFALGKDELSFTTDTIFNRPVAKLALSSYTGQVGEEFYFDATSSYSLDGAALRFDWDLDGDGVFELTDAASAVSYVYNSETEHYIQVRVSDSHEKSSTMSAYVQVASSSATLASITQLSAVPQSDDTVAVEFRTDGSQVLLATNDLLQGFVEVADGAGRFTLRDVTSTLTITLTPYSASGERGVQSSLTVSSGVEESRSPQLPDGTDVNLVPKAPNTGLVSREPR